MFYSRRDLICSGFWIVLMCIVAYLPGQVEETDNSERSWRSAEDWRGRRHHKDDGVLYSILLLELS